MSSKMSINLTIYRKANDIFKHLSLSMALLLPTQSWGEAHVQFNDLPDFQVAATTFVLAVVCIKTVPDELNRFKEVAVEARNEMLQQARVANVFSAEELTELSDTTLKSLNDANYDADADLDPFSTGICAGLLEN